LVTGPLGLVAHLVLYLRGAGSTQERFVCALDVLSNRFIPKDLDTEVPQSRTVGHKAPHALCGCVLVYRHCISSVAAFARNHTIFSSTSMLLWVWLLTRPLLVRPQLHGMLPHVKR
jgi:hypothetical protein